MTHNWATIPRRVSIATIAICCAILGIGAMICIQVYRAHEIGEMDLLLGQDLLIEARRIAYDGARAEILQSVGQSPYDLTSEQWFWQLTRDGSDEILIQSPSLGPVTAESRVLAVPEAGGNFVIPGGDVLRGKRAAFPGAEPDEALTFRIAAPLMHVTEEIRRAGKLIALIFFGLAMLVSVSVYITVNRGLVPLKRLSKSVKAMRKSDTIIDDQKWPPDLVPVVEELRELHWRNGTIIEKHRRKNAELAHGLKTPLAALARVAEELEGDRGEQITDLVGRMTGVIKRNLSRARTERPYGKSSPVHASAEDVTFALGITFRNRMPGIENSIDAGTIFWGEEADIQEILGNLLENACLWAKSRVRISVATPEPGMFTLSVEDDGPGMGTGKSEVPARKDGNDEPEGHGLGLLIVQDIAELYGGSVNIGTSSLGGARVSVTLPGQIEAYRKSGTRPLKGNLRRTN
ncbi:sensor histidine kinase [uncultured Ruegeria sp.]|uniref:sensor histidine kinase n=1 Tax=uncultured Ruegeria sp. TaxID=259304 RepID=UPI00261E5F97|nr:sensor histidine kinase [uncultured Ruegeria sp.]